MEHQTYFHSVTLNKDLCHGCITCVKRCPTTVRTTGITTLVIVSKRTDTTEFT